MLLHPYPTISPILYKAVVTPAPWARWSFAQVLPNWRVHWRPSDRKPLVDWKRLGNGLSHKSSGRLPEILMVQTIQNRGLVARFATFYPYLWSFQQGESWQTIKFGGIKKKKHLWIPIFTVHSNVYQLGCWSLCSTVGTMTGDPRSGPGHDPPRPGHPSGEPRLCRSRWPEWWSTESVGRSRNWSSSWVNGQKIHAVHGIYIYTVSIRELYTSGDEFSNGKSVCDWWESKNLILGFPAQC